MIFGLPYETGNSLPALILGLLFICCSYRLGKGGDKERRAALMFFVVVLMSKIVVGIIQIGKQGHLFVGICCIVTALICAFIMTDRNIYLKLRNAPAPKRS